jgi:hypothetical protein
MIARHIRTTEAGYAVVDIDGEETYVAYPDMTPEAAAAKWVLDAKGIALSPPEKKVEELLTPIEEALADLTVLVMEMKDTLDALPKGPTP